MCLKNSTVIRLIYILTQSNLFGKIVDQSVCDRAYF